MMDMLQIPWDDARQRIHMYLRQTHQIDPSIEEMCKFIQITKSARETYGSIYSQAFIYSEMAWSTLKSSLPSTQISWSLSFSFGKLGHDLWITSNSWVLWKSDFWHLKRKWHSFSTSPNKHRSYNILYTYTQYMWCKTTMTTGAWSWLISFAWAPLSCSERKIKIYVSSGVRTHATTLMTCESAL